MSEYVWLFPVLFIVHDMEEIIGFGLWLKRNGRMLEQKYPAIFRTYQSYSTEGMAAAVLEELLLCLLICIVSRASDFYFLWLGGFIAYAVHLFMHIIQSIVIRRYIPALITSVACLPISIFIIVNCINLINASGGKIMVYSVIGVILTAGNLKFAHVIMEWFTKKIVNLEA